MRAVVVLVLSLNSIFWTTFGIKTALMRKIIAQHSHFEQK